MSGRSRQSVARCWGFNDCSWDSLIASRQSLFTLVARGRRCKDGSRHSLHSNCNTRMAIAFTLQEFVLISNSLLQYLPLVLSVYLVLY